MRRWWGVFIHACASAGHERRARENGNDSIFTVTVRPNNIYAVEGRRSRCHPHLEVIWAFAESRAEYLFTVEAGGQIRPASPQSVYTHLDAHTSAHTPTAPTYRNTKHMAWHVQLEMRASHEEIDQNSRPLRYLFISTNTPKNMPHLFTRFL